MSESLDLAGLSAAASSGDDAPGGEAGASPGARMSGTPGPGGGPDGVPLAIAVSPILSARVRAGDLDRIREAAPGARIVNLSVEGLADGPIDDVEVLLRGFLSAEAFDRLLARAPGLSWVHSATSGVERALTSAALARGVVVTNARGVFTRPIAEHVLLMILAISRRLPQLLELQRERTWQPVEGRELRDLTIGIVGYGSLGRAIASLATAFGCRVIAIRRRPGAADSASGDPQMAAGSPGVGETTSGDDDDDGFPVAPRLQRVYGPDRLHDFLAESDVVVLAAPLTPATEGMIGEAALAAMRPGAWLINVARGRLVDEVALVRALRAGQIGGAALDTFSDEPLQPSSPFYDLPNVIVTPHTAWSSARVLDRSIDLFCDNLRRYRAGEPLRNVVDPTAGY
jgi:phosphoglycerate dehydrogenase-like enzyme